MLITVLAALKSRAKGAGRGIAERELTFRQPEARICYCIISKSVI